MDNATADACMVARTTMEASTKLRGRRRRESGASTRRSRTRSTSSTRSSSTHTLRRQRYRRRMPRSSSSALGTLRWCKSTTRLRWRSRTTFSRRTLTQTATGRRRTRNRHVFNVPDTPANPGPAPLRTPFTSHPATNRTRRLSGGCLRVLVPLHVLSNPPRGPKNLPQQILRQEAPQQSPPEECGSSGGRHQRAAQHLALPPGRGQHGLVRPLQTDPSLILSLALLI